MDEIGPLYLPCRQVAPPIIAPEFHAVFEDAADLDAGQGEYDTIQLQAFGFEVDQIGGRGGQWNDGSIGVDGTALDLANLVDAVLVGNADRGQFLAFLGEHLDAVVNDVGMIGVIGGVLVVKVDSRRAWGFGVGGHFELFLGWLLKLSDEQGWRGQGEDQERHAEPRARRHDAVVGRCGKVVARGGEHQLPFGVADMDNTNCP